MSCSRRYFDGGFPKASILLLGMSLAVFIQPHHGSSKTGVVAFAPNHSFYRNIIPTASSRNNLVCFLTKQEKQQESNNTSNINKSFFDENKTNSSREKLNVVGKIRSWARRLTGISISSIVAGKRRRRLDDGIDHKVNAEKADLFGEISESPEMEEKDDHTDVERGGGIIQNSLGAPPEYNKKQQQQFLGGDNDRILAAKVAVIAKERRKAEEERKKIERNISMTLNAEEDATKVQNLKKEKEEEQIIQAERIIDGHKEVVERKHLVDGKTTENSLEEPKVHSEAEKLIVEIKAGDGQDEGEAEKMVTEEATSEKVGEQEDSVQAERISEGCKEEEEKKEIEEDKEENIVEIKAGDGQLEEEAEKMVTEDATSEKVGEKEDNVQAERISEGYKEEEEKEEIEEDKEENIVEIKVGDGQDEEEPEKMVTEDAASEKVVEQEDSVQVERISEGCKEEEEKKEIEEDKEEKIVEIKAGDGQAEEVQEAEKMLTEEETDEKVGRKKEKIPSERIVDGFKKEEQTKRKADGKKKENAVEEKQETSKETFDKKLGEMEEDEYVEQTTEQYEDIKTPVGKKSKIADETALARQSQQAIPEGKNIVPENTCEDVIHMEVIREEELSHLKRSESIREVLNRPRSTEEDAIISLRYGEMSAEDRAFNILLDLGLIEIHLDPDDPTSIGAEDDEFYPANNR